MNDEVVELAKEIRSSTIQELNLVAEISKLKATLQVQEQRTARMIKRWEEQ